MASARRMIAVASIGLLAPHVAAQYSGWQENQVNATICNWSGLRAAAVNDTLYIDGGTLVWQQGFADGSYDDYPDENLYALVYTLGLNNTIGTDFFFNVTEQFGTLSKARGGGSGNGNAPNANGGGMLANDHEFFLYGGLIAKTDSADPPDANEVIAYEKTQYGPYRELWGPGFVDWNLPEDMSWFVAYGAAVNAPSENKAWYFSGQRAPSWGRVYEPLTDLSENPSEASDNLITLDLSDQTNPQWTNTTLGPDIDGRGGASVVWVPVGEQGILVAIGGVTYPEYANYTASSDNEGASRAESPGFMTTIDIYDVAGDQWYQQTVTSDDAPTQLTLGCAVVAAAEDYTSYNIYYFGGYDGLEAEDEAAYTDDVWVLSLPSFFWIKVKEGDGKHIRAGHHCFTPYPDQMMIFGGYFPNSGGTQKCLEGVVNMMNLTDGSWMEEYNPSVYAETYSVPAAVYAIIGGNEKGGSRTDQPFSPGWSSDELATVFGTSYDTSKLTQNWPYASTTSEDDPERTDAPEENSGGGGGTPKWVAPVLGVVLGLVFVTAVIVAILLYRRRKLLKRNGGLTESGTDENGNRIISWIRGQTNSDKAPTVTTEESPAHHLDEMESRSTPHRGIENPPTQPYYSELPHTPRFELQDTSPRVELGDTGLSPVDVIDKHTRFGTSPRGGHTNATPTNPSTLSQPGTAYTGSISQDHVSTDTPGNGSIAARHQAHERAVSPEPTLSELAAQDAATMEVSREQHEQSHKKQQPERSTIVSGVSALSERTQAHLRQLSDTTVSTASRGGTPEPGAAVAAAGTSTTTTGGRVDSPTPPPLVSPPTAGDGYETASDYISVHQGTTTTTSGHQQHSMMTSTQNNQSSQSLSVAGQSSSSPLRRASVFSEDRTDLGDTDGGADKGR